MARVIRNLEKRSVKVVVLVDGKILGGSKRSTQRRRRVGQGEVESDVRYQTKRRGQHPTITLRPKNRPLQDEVETYPDMMN